MIDLRWIVMRFRMRDWWGLGCVECQGVEVIRSRVKVWWWSGAGSGSVCVEGQDQVWSGSGRVEGQGELWSGTGYPLWSGSGCGGQDLLSVRVWWSGCIEGQVVVLWSGLLYTCGQGQVNTCSQEQSSVVKVGNVRGFR